MELVLTAKATVSVDPSVVLHEEWITTDGSAWNTNSWTTSYTGGGVANVNVVSEEGNLYVASGDAKAVAKTAKLPDPEVLLTYRFDAPNIADARAPQSGFRVTLSGDGAFPLTSGYRVDVQSDSKTVKLRRFQNGSNQSVKEFTYTKDALPQRMRFYVDRGTVGVKIWPASQRGP